MTLTKFKSITGIALTSAESGESVKVSYRLNCNEDIPGLNKFKMARNILDSLVFPEILTRIRKGTLSINFRLRKAHILMFSNESKNQLLLNGRTQFLIQVDLKQGVELMKKIGEDEIERVLGIYPNKQKNAAQIMLFKFKGEWLISYDYTYNAERARDRVKIAKGDIRKSEEYLMKENLKLFASNQLKAAKLLVSSILMLNNHKLDLKTNPITLNELFAGFAKNGNIDMKYSNYFEKVIDLYDRLKNKNGSPFPQYEMNDILNTSKSLVEVTEKKLNGVAFYRTPPSGIYIQN